MSAPDPRAEVRRVQQRREFLRRASAGTVITALGGGLYHLLGDSLTRAAASETRPDGRPRVPPGQRVIAALKPMGGQAGDPRASAWSLRVHGAVEAPFSLDFRELLAMPTTECTADVHCVTGWSVLGARWKGVRIRELARRARAVPGARFVILEAAHGYTANVDRAAIMTDDALVAWELDGRALARPHGSPVRAMIPDRYFWKSAKWLTGIRFATRDDPGYWEVRGYHNRADPWLEERYA